MTFHEFFEVATGYSPYPYQTKLAAEPVQNRALEIPTGAGKTAAVVLSWLYRRQVDRKNTPRRLILCQPMRTLVEQALANIRVWKSRLGLSTGVYAMLAGEIDRNWDIRPEDEAIIVGTQDLLLSAALNRGYAMKRYRWPISFGLLNNDCLWVLDEVQLMGAGLPTSTQLAALRPKFRVFGKCPSIWMSATLDPDSLKTVDFARTAESMPVTRLTSEDESEKSLADRLNATKQVQGAPEACCLPVGLAEFIVKEHEAGTQTLVVLNRVVRARETYDALLRAFTGAQPDIRLLHSRFRGSERREWAVLLNSPIPEAGRILVATQVIEAGVDISSSLMVSDLAPYSSMVQRFGRCNRDGKAVGARIFWVDRPLMAKQARFAAAVELTEGQHAEIAAPYDPEELAQARTILSDLTSASPKNLKPVPHLDLAVPVVRMRDIVDLFDTTRDLSGFDIDISRFVRSGPDRDVFVAWRDVTADGPLRESPRPTADELCPAPIGEDGVSTSLR